MNEITSSFVNIIFLVLPLSIFILYKKGYFEELNKNNYLLGFFRAYVLTLGVIYLIQIIVSIYITQSTGFYAPLVCFLMCFIILFHFKDHDIKIKKKCYYLNLTIVLIIILFWVSQPLLDKDITPPQIEDITPIIFLIILFSTITPFLSLYIIRKYYTKRAFEEELEVRDLRYLTGYFMILVLVFGLVSLSTMFFTFEPAILFSGVELGDIGGSIDMILTTISSDGLFVFTVVITGIASVVTTLGTRQAIMFGNMFMTFMPMIMFLQYAFGDIPQEIMNIFPDFEWLGRVFYIVLTLMLMAMFLSAWKLIAGITTTRFHI